MQTSALETEPFSILDGISPAASQAPFRDLAQEEVDAFQRDGVICLRQLYGSEWRDALSEALEAVGLRDPGQRTRIKSGVFEWLSNDVIRDFILFGPTAKPVAQALGRLAAEQFWRSGLHQGRPDDGADAVALRLDLLPNRRGSGRLSLDRP